MYRWLLLGAALSLPCFSASVTIDHFAGAQATLRAGGFALVNGTPRTFVAGIRQTDLTGLVDDFRYAVVSVTNAGRLVDRYAELRLTGSSLAYFAIDSGSASGYVELTYDGVGSPMPGASTSLYTSQNQLNGGAGYDLTAGGTIKQLGLVYLTDNAAFQPTITLFSQGASASYTAPALGVTNGAFKGVYFPFAQFGNVDVEKVTGIQLRMSATSGGNIFFDLFDATSVPEPGTYALMGFGLVGLGLLARKRRK